MGGPCFLQQPLTSPAGQAYNSYNSHAGKNSLKKMLMDWNTKQGLNLCPTAVLQVTMFRCAVHCIVVGSCGSVLFRCAALPYNVAQL